LHISYILKTKFAAKYDDKHINIHARDKLVLSDLSTGKSM